MKGSENNPKTVVCFDFDQTIVNGHLHGALKNQGLEGIGAYGKDRLFVDSKPVNPDGFVNSEYNAQAVASAAMNPEVYGGLKGGEQLKATFQKMLEQGHEIVITSNTQYPDGIKAVLETQCGFTKEQLDKIVIVGGFPSDGADNNPSGKNEHLAKVMEMKGITDPRNVILVDDSPNNISAANANGIRTIPVSKDYCPPAEATHLDNLVAEAGKMREEAIAKSAGVEGPGLSQSAPDILSSSLSNSAPAESKASPSPRTNPLAKQVGVDRDAFARLTPEQQTVARNKILNRSANIDPVMPTNEQQADRSSLKPTAAPIAAPPLTEQQQAARTESGLARMNARNEIDIDQGRTPRYAPISTNEQQQTDLLPPVTGPAKATPAPKQEMQQQVNPRSLEPKEQKLIRNTLDKNLEQTGQKPGFMTRLFNIEGKGKAYEQKLDQYTKAVVTNAQNLGVEVGKIAKYNSANLTQAITSPSADALQRIQNNHQGINDFLKAVDPKAQERFAENSSNIFPSKRFANRAAEAFVKIDATIGVANTANIAKFAEAYIDANKGKDGKGSFPKEFIDNPKLNTTLVRAATADPRMTADVIKEMKGKDVVSFDKPKDFDKVFTPVVNAVVTSGKLESAKTTMDLINSDAKRTGMAAAFRGDLDYKKVDAITKGAQPNGEVNKPIDSMSKNERLQQSAHIAATYPNVHKLAEEALKEQSKTTGKEGKATNRDICKFAEGLQKQGVDLKALDSKIGADPQFKQAFKGTLTQKSETIKIDKAQEKQINTANKENTYIEKDPRRAIKPDNIQQIKNHTVIDSIMNKQNKSFALDIEKLSSQLRSEMKPASKSANTPSSLTVNTAAMTPGAGAHR